ncbi:uncharacterized protein cubi_01361 [Cryptosporidium ubiquitum]|uniref:Uncharacterized protein n=1 Tax=Cryptosporidium ubiquitum TaxID=857276 RepID=A0A1J4MG81_9CRYT|nr:uncharacterized protein cubi_01361 [Cryptosporidium ubiquitum]OII72028.1 hypothetical protein cubi_01361 [Cryptosporidium ubiquitum]
MIDDTKSLPFVKTLRSGGMITGFSAAIFQVKPLLLLSAILIFSSIITSNNSDIQRTITLMGFLTMGFMSIYLMPNNVLFDKRDAPKNNSTNTDI